MGLKIAGIRQIGVTLSTVEPLSLLAKRVAIPRSTHIPVLLGLSILLKPRSVLELGSGHYSTPLFTNDRFFPTVERFRSIEDDPAWFATIRRDIALREPDSVELAEDMPRWVRDTEDSLDGLIFLDNGRSMPDRVATIAAMLERCGPDAVVVIHDFEQKAYRLAVPSSWSAVTVRSWLPATGILCRDPSRLDGFRRLSRLIRENRDIPPERAEEWALVLQRLN